MQPPIPTGRRNEHLDHLSIRRLPLGPVVHRAHPFEQMVVLRIHIVGGVFAVLERAALRPVEQEQEVLRIRIVGIPAEEEHLRRALAHLFLEAIEIGVANHQLQVDLRQLFNQPVGARLSLRANQCAVEVDHQGFAARGFDQRDALVIQAAANERQHARLVVHGKNRDRLFVFHKASCALYQSARSI